MSSNSALTSESASLPVVGDTLELDGVRVEVYARAQLPTVFGDFEIFVFRSNTEEKEHVAVVRGDSLSGEKSVFVRVHSECLTGDVLGSLRCDCRDQLHVSLRLLGEEDRGALLYMRQEGRGIGLGNKIRAYTLQQEEGLDTVEANEHLGFDDDLRDYRISVLMLKLLGVESVALATNNPLKVEGLRNHGIIVEHRVPLLTGVNSHNTDYLVTKARKSGHLLPF